MEKEEFTGSVAFVAITVVIASVIVAIIVFIIVHFATKGKGSISRVGVAGGTHTADNSANAGGGNV